MQDLQAVFLRIQENKRKLKDLRGTYKEALNGVEEYKRLQEELETMREKKKGIEQVTREQFSHECTQMEDLKIDIASDEELMSDIAMTELMSGKTIEVKDKDEQEYEPVINVKFKKR
ncbi:MAG: hypothetical protein A3J66_03575 [Candidatus Magasanikbacteria bacterium RIFCSPHIGHO2_02_FULL_47_14]|uniref:Uncharacterized protein n=1 Tax=Candidatus Magasanikbacteria bacterium RIFCSPHIGHO2_02_FULL_47_14 TaxID=1798680 RepID=A0A1F6M790_9BACT|nr:MAG: hypothetical protein A3J66_03575 [Candidatus Magasanikbacteria bacterium RIFCSPHIGHO2_02_FULL_47_14]